MFTIEPARRLRIAGTAVFILRNHGAGIASLDLFVVRTISFKLLYGFVTLRHARRRRVTISVTSNPTAEWIAGQVTDAFPWDEAPRHLIRDRDGAFGPAYTHRIRAMGIRDHPTAPRSPWQNGHVERLIGSIRRESLDHLVVFEEAQLRCVPKNYASYYNQSGCVDGPRNRLHRKSWFPDLSERTSSSDCDRRSPPRGASARR